MSDGKDANAKESSITQNLPLLRQKTSQHALNDILNAIEFDLFYQAAPIRTIGIVRLNRRKLRTERLTFLVSANADSTENYQLMVIGRSKHSRFFSSLGLLERGFDHHSNSGARINT